MAFMLEKEYRIQFPRADILERAAQHFREEDLVVSGVVTPLGLEMLRRGMPELDPTKFRPGLKAIDVVKMISVGSFARITVRLLEAKAEAPRTARSAAPRSSSRPSCPNSSARAAARSCRSRAGMISCSGT